jgi:NADH-ubiquinone oxidoreductase subunit b14.5b (NDUFC2)
MSHRALDILTDDPNREKTFLTVHYPLYGTAAFGFAAVCFVNWMTRRPVFSGLFS